MVYKDYNSERPVGSLSHKKSGESIMQSCFYLRISSSISTMLKLAQNFYWLHKHIYVENQHKCISWQTLVYPLKSEYTWEIIQVSIYQNICSTYRVNFRDRRRQNNVNSWLENCTGLNIGPRTFHAKHGMLTGMISIFKKMTDHIAEDLLSWVDKKIIQNKRLWGDLLRKGVDPQTRDQSRSNQRKFSAEIFVIISMRSSSKG